MQWQPRSMWDMWGTWRHLDDLLGGPRPPARLCECPWGADASCCPSVGKAVNLQVSWGTWCLWNGSGMLCWWWQLQQLIPFLLCSRGRNRAELCSLPCVLHSPHTAVVSTAVTHFSRAIFCIENHFCYCWQVGKDPTAFFPATLSCSFSCSGMQEEVTSGSTPLPADAQYDCID